MNNRMPGILRLAVLCALIAMAYCGLPAYSKTGSAFASSQGMFRLETRTQNLQLCGKSRRPSFGVATSLRAQESSEDKAATRRDVLFLAMASGAAYLTGPKSASAAGGSGPAEVDGPSADKSAIRSTAPGKDRNKIKVSANKESKDVAFPKDVKTLTAEYKKTESGLFFKELKVGEGTTTPQPGDTLEIQYVGSVCEVDKNGEYDCATREGLSEIYPTMPQGIIRDSPKYDSSFDRGRTLKARYKRAQLSLGIEEALADMKPGGVKMLLLIPELSIACPKARVCVADIDVDERMAFYLELVAINPPDIGPNVNATSTRPTQKRRKLWGGSETTSAEQPASPPGAPANMQPAAPGQAVSAPASATTAAPAATSAAAPAPAPASAPAVPAAPAPAASAPAPAATAPAPAATVPAASQVAPAPAAPVLAPK